MPVTLDSLGALASLPFDEIIDVRSPSEFAEDHIPGAINLPVLSDAERARVGTIYVQEDKFLARKIGAALVA
ncbi:rhodanese-like domain-containing protein, partial [Roseovarius tolerans]